MKKTLETTTIRLATSKDQSAVIAMANDVYASSEKEFWKEGYYRLNEEEFNRYEQAKWLYLAEIDDELVGCVLMRPVDKITTSFSMLICHPNHRKKGIGKTLVEHVFKTAREKNYQKMQLEILTPIDWVHKEKEFLKTWYTSLDFKLVKEVNFLDYYPNHGHFMKCPLLFSLYEKDLTT